MKQIELKELLEQIRTTNTMSVNMSVLIKKLQNLLKELINESEN